MISPDIMGYPYAAGVGGVRAWTVMDRVTTRHTHRLRRVIVGLQRRGAGGAAGGSGCIQGGVNIEHWCCLLAVNRPEELAYGPYWIFSVQSIKTRVFV